MTLINGSLLYASVNTTSTNLVLVRNERAIRLMLKKFKLFQKQHKLIDEMKGEVYALEYVLEDRDDLF